MVQCKIILLNNIKSYKNYSSANNNDENKTIKLKKTSNKNNKNNIDNNNNNAFLYEFYQQYNLKQKMNKSGIQVFCFVKEMMKLIKVFNFKIISVAITIIIKNYF
jgi:hypothetical protein